MLFNFFGIKVKRFVCSWALLGVYQSDFVSPHLVTLVLLLPQSLFRFIVVGGQWDLGTKKENVYYVLYFVCLSWGLVRNWFVESYSAVSGDFLLNISGQECKRVCNWSVPGVARLYCVNCLFDLLATIWDMRSLGQYIFKVTIPIYSLIKIYYVRVIWGITHRTSSTSEQKTSAGAIWRGRRQLGLSNPGVHWIEVSAEMKKAIDFPTRLRGGGSQMQNWLCNERRRANRCVCSLSDPQYLMTRKRSILAKLADRPAPSSTQRSLFDQR